MSTPRDYAADLARLEDHLRRVTDACVEVARTMSLEEAASRLARAAVELLGLERAAVYVLRKDRPFLAAHHPLQAQAFPTVAAATRQDLEALEGEADLLACAPWSQLTGGATAVVPLLGRRRPVGFLCGEGPLPLEGGATIERWMLALLAGEAGVVLENHLMEALRGERQTGVVVLPPPPPTGPRHGMLGQSPAMKRALALAGRLARVDSAVLVRGETGTGKALFARALHEGGPRAGGPFVVVNCGAIPEALVESELFGHEAGAFTGAVRQHAGRIEQAEGGTLFLDEVGELPLAAQVKLLTFLEERRFTRVGGEEPLEADVRIVSATNRDLDQAVAAREFRADLLWRLNVFTVELPPLRERGADVVAIARAFAHEVAAQYALPAPVLGPEVEARLLGYDWPGNVRELRNVIEKAVILSEGGAVAAELLPGPSAASARAAAAAAPAPAAGLEAQDPAELQGSFGEAKLRVLERWELAYLQQLLRRVGGNIARAAREARVDKKHLHRKLRRYGIDAAALRAEAARRATG